MRRPLAHLLALLLMAAGAALLLPPAGSDPAPAGRSPALAAKAVEKVRAPSSPPPDPDERLAEPRRQSEWRCRAGAAPAAESALAAGAASFSVHFQDEVSSLPLVPAFVMPSRTVELEAVLEPRGARFSARAEAGRLVRSGAAQWSWTAPARAGVYDLEIREAGGDAVCVRAFVMVPYDGREVFGHYRIGRYEPKPLRGDPAYRVPEGLVEVSDANRDTWLTPHFQLRQFECKQAGDDPHYLILTTRLLTKLEALLGAVRDAGIDARTLFVMSGYRTPHYNRSIGNRTRYSRHSYGDAADVFVDEDRDGRMDDLDGDGDGDAADARRLYEVADGLASEAWYRPLVGGLALYGPAPHRGPFIHVDARGSRARW